MHFPTRKTLALLAYLAVTPGAHSREALTALFWPGSDAAHGRAALRNTLAYLRAALAEGAGPPIRLWGDRDRLAFEPVETSLDLDELQVALVGHDVPRQMVAAKLCRGPFLEGLSLVDAPEFEDWLATQRAHWSGHVDRLMDRLSQNQLDRGDIQGAAATSAHWLALEPFQEPALRRLIQAQLAAGDADTAYRTYEQGRRILQAAQIDALEPETQALGETARAARAGRSTAAATPPHRAEAHGFAIFAQRFAGREREFQALVAEYFALATGGARAVALVGEAGIGKSRLAGEFARWVIAQGGQVLQGRAMATFEGTAEEAGRVPYQAVVEALRRRLEHENAPEDLVADVWSSELGRILPELHDRYPDLPQAPAGEVLGSGRLFEAVARLIQAFAGDSPARAPGATAKSRPILFVVDDLQWADAATLELLQYTARRWWESGTPVLLLFTLREPAAPGWLSALGKDLPVAIWTLGPLSLASTLQWLGTQDADPGRAAFGRWLFGETGGQPFFLTETLQMLIESGVLAESADALGGGFDFEAALRQETEMRGVLPPRVREVVQARLTRLSAAARRLLAAAAILSSDFRFQTACQVAGLDELEALTPLDELLRGHLLVEASAGEPRYRFGHDKIREAVYAEAGEARRQVLHRRALDILAASAAPAAELAVHARAASAQASAFRYALDAGDAALAVFAVRDAIAQYESARRSGETLGETARDSRVHLLLQLGRAYELSGAMDQALAVYRELLALGRAGGLSSIACLALNRQATVTAQAVFDLPGALRLLEEADQAAEQSREAGDRAETDWNFAQIQYYARDLQAARARAERALALARALDRPELIARCLNISAYVAFDLGDLALAQDCAEEGYRTYVALGNRAMEVDSLCQLTGVLACRGDLAGGIERGRLALAISHEIDNAWGQIFSGFRLGCALADAGEMEEARALLSAAAEQATHESTPLLLELCRVALGGVERGLGRPEEALAIHLKGAPRAAAPASVADWIQGIHLPDLCADYAVLGRWPEAFSCAKQVDTYTGVIPAFGRLYSLYHEVEALLRGGDTEAAERTLARYQALAGDNPRFRIPALRAQAVIAEFQGQARARTGLLEEALKLAAQLGIAGEHRQISALLA